MIDHKISNQVLTLGVKHTPPVGGIAQLINSYKNIISPFKFISTTGISHCKVMNLIILFIAIVKIIVQLPSYKIAHIHTASNVSFWRKTLLINILKLCNKKIIIHIHGGKFKEFYNTSPDKIKSTLLKADRVVVLSNSWKLYFENIIGLNNVCVVNNVISKPMLTKTEKNDKIHFLFLGNLSRAKGFFDLFEAIITSKKELEGKAVFHIGGNGDVEEINNYIVEHDVKDLIKLHGFVQGAIKNELLNKCDVFILPSYIEGLPISILEAMSYGAAIISTKVGGIPDIVNSNNGILINPGEINELASSIIFLINNPVIVEKMKTEGLKISNSYSKENVEHQLFQLYLEVLNE